MVSTREQDLQQEFTVYEPPPLQFDGENDPQQALPQDLSNRIQAIRANYNTGSLSLRQPAADSQSSDDTENASSSNTTPNHSLKPAFLTETFQTIFRAPPAPEDVAPPMGPDCDVTKYKVARLREDLSTVSCRTQNVSRTLDNWTATFDQRAADAIDSHITALVLRNSHRCNNVEEVFRAMDFVFDELSAIDSKFNRLQSKVDTAKARIRHLSRQTAAHERTIDTSDRNLAHGLVRLDWLYDNLRPTSFVRL